MSCGFINTFIKQILVLFVMVTTNAAFPNSLDSKRLFPVTGFTLDVYGTDKIDVKRIKSKYHKRWQTIIQLALARKDYESIAKPIVAEIKSAVTLNFISINVVRYPGDKLVHLTIDVVEKSDIKRKYHFNEVPRQSIQDPEYLIEKWQAYEKEAYDLIFKKGIFPGTQHCPAWHCVFGFEHPRLKKYQAWFGSPVVDRNITTLTKILNNDKDANKRKMAALLLAHATNVQEIVEALIPATHDPDAAVRNNAMRVLGVIFINMANRKNDIVKFLITKKDLVKLAEGLNFPQTSDRNKALMMIASLVDRPDFADYIREHYSNNLLTELKMQQPDLHDFAYIILKKISGKHYAENNYPAWGACCHRHRRR